MSNNNREDALRKLEDKVIEYIRIHKKDPDISVIRAFAIEVGLDNVELVKADDLLGKKNGDKLEHTGKPVFKSSNKNARRLSQEEVYNLINK